jgi:hypothetical protein
VLGSLGPWYLVRGWRELDARTVRGRTRDGQMPEVQRCDDAAWMCDVSFEGRTFRPTARDDLDTFGGAAAYP